MSISEGDGPTRAHIPRGKTSGEDHNQGVSATKEIVEGGEASFRMAFVPDHQWAAKPDASNSHYGPNRDAG